MKNETLPVVLEFASAMEAKLAQNRAKGNREGWLSIPTDELLKRLLAEVDELRGAITGGEPVAILYEAADVANFAMMIADVCGGLLCRKPSVENKEEPK